ncbi:MAG: fibronectin type III domain-containing protein [Patescibacteria group bacterium]
MMIFGLLFAVVVSAAGIMYLHHLGMGPRFNAGVNRIRSWAGMTWGFVLRLYYDQIVRAARAARMIPIAIAAALALSATVVGIATDLPPIAMGTVAGASLLAMLVLYLVGRNTEAHREGTVTVPAGDDHVNVNFAAMDAPPLIRVFPFNAADDFGTANVTNTGFTIEVDAQPVARVFNWTVRSRPEGSVLLSLGFTLFWAPVVLWAITLGVGIQYDSAALKVLCLMPLSFSVALLFALWRIGVWVAEKTVDGIEFGPNLAIAIVRAIVTLNPAPVAELLSHHVSSAKQAWNLFNQEAFKRDFLLWWLRTLAILMAVHSTAILTHSWAGFGAFRLVEFIGFGIVASYEYLIASFRSQAKNGQKGRKKNARMLEKVLAGMRITGLSGYVLVTLILTVVAVVSMLSPEFAKEVDTFYASLGGVVIGTLRFASGMLKQGAAAASICLVFVGLVFLIRKFWPEGWTRGVATCIAGLVALVSFGWFIYLGVGQSAAETVDRTASGTLFHVMPLNLRVMATDRNAKRGAYLTWSDVPDAVSYRIERRELHEPAYSPLKKSAASEPYVFAKGATSFEDTPLDEGNTYFYRIVSTNAEKKERTSGEVAVPITKAPPAPSATPAASHKPVATRSKHAASRSKDLQDICANGACD